MIRSPSPQERIAVATGGRELEAVARQERQWHIKRDNDDGDDDDGEKKDDQKINSKSTFRPPQSRKGAP
jgi:hypothetical protein